MNRRALVVDDEPTVCQMIQDVMNSTGMTVLTLTKSSEAAEYLRDEKFDLVLLDMRMPAPDGIEVARQTRGSGFNRLTPIIMLSDDQNLSAVSEGFQAGASFFLYKPIDKGRLLHLIRATRGAIEHEKRRFRRVPHRAKVQLTSDKIRMHGETVDISLNGLLVEAATCLPRGAMVEVSLDLWPGNKPIEGSGLVMRTINEKQMGIEFNLLSRTESSRLQEFLLPLIQKE
ncbi:MAG: response regulator [Candidatus Acidiferrales bacterium]